MVKPESQREPTHFLSRDEVRKLEALYVRRTALDLAIRRLEDYCRLRAKRLANSLLKIA